MFQRHVKRAQRSSNSPSQEFQKSTVPPLTHLAAAQKPQKYLRKFSVISMAPIYLYKGHKQAPFRKHYPSSTARSAKTIRERTVGPTGGVLRRIPRYIFGGSCGAPFSHLFQRGLPRLPPPSRSPKTCRAKQLPVKMHQNENIHSGEYNKTACQTCIFHFMQVNTEL